MGITDVTSMNLCRQIRSRRSEMNVSNGAHIFGLHGRAILVRRDISSCSLSSPIPIEERHRYIGSEGFRKIPAGIAPRQRLLDFRYKFNALGTFIILIQTRQAARIYSPYNSSSFRRLTILSVVDGPREWVVGSRTFGHPFSRFSDTDSVISPTTVLHSNNRCVEFWVWDNPVYCDRDQVL